MYYSLAILFMLAVGLFRVVQLLEVIEKKLEKANRLKVGVYEDPK
jgi:hypothetical protein